MKKSSTTIYIKVVTVLALLVFLSAVGFYIYKPEEINQEKGLNTFEAPILEKIENVESPTPSFPSSPASSKQAAAPSEQNIDSAQEKKESVTLLAGDMTTRLSITPGATFYDTLVEAQKEGKISFIGKNYLGMGFFITDIGTLHSGGGKDLLYYVNGKEATVGVSSYTLKDGDVIEWKLK